jgi:hypothetical protein
MISINMCESSDRRRNNDIAMVSSTPGSVSTTSNMTSIEDRKLNMEEVHTDDWYPRSWSHSCDIYSAVAVGMVVDNKRTRSNSGEKIPGRAVFGSAVFIQSAGAAKFHDGIEKRMYILLCVEYVELVNTDVSW